MKALKVGIVGCGGIANGKHMPAMKAAADAEMVAFCDIVVERAEKAKKDFGTAKAKVFTDYKELLKEDLDVVCVCTPNVSHCEITVASLESGKNTICEKPMAMNYAEAKMMIDAKNKSKKLLSIGYQNRYRPDSLYLKRECENGSLGEVYFAKAHAIRRRAVPMWGVFLDEAKQGGGPLIDIGTHALDLTLFMMDNYKPKYAVGSVYHKLNANDKGTGNAWGDWKAEEFTVEDSAFGYVVMENGATIFVESSWALNTIEVREASVTLCGDKGGAEMTLKDGLVLNGVKNGTLITEKPEFNTGGVDYFTGSGGNPGEREAATFLNAVRGKGKLYVEPEQAAVVTMILEGIYESGKTGKPYYFAENTK